MKASRKITRRISRGPRKSSAERKDFLVQARVPRDLDDVLKREAKRRRLSVSHLIRNVLEDTYNLVEGVIDEVDSLVQDSVRLGDRVRRDAQQLARSARGHAVRDDAGAADVPRSPSVGVADPSQETPRRETRVEAVSGAGNQAHREAPEHAPSAAQVPRAAAPSAGHSQRADDDFEARTADVFAWNPVVLHRATSCVRCGQTLQRGAAAHMAVSERPSAPPRWLCQACILAL